MLCQANLSEKCNCTEAYSWDFFSTTGAAAIDLQEKRKEGTVDEKKNPR